MHSPELPNLMQIRAFIRVVEYGSVSKAATVLFRAQSVVTRAILDLEKRLGALLFERNANGMRLTDYGEGVLPRARRATDELLAVPPLLGQIMGSAAEPLYLFQTRRLEVFAKLCETHHMQTTANILGISQPAISAAIKVLEQGSGTRLFERTPHGVLPTRLCLKMLVRVRRALNELRHIDADIAALGGTLQGAVHVGALPLGRTGILPEAIVRLTLEHPEVRIVTNESPFDLLASELRAGDVDFVLGALRPSAYASDLHSEALLQEEMVILVRRDHPWLKRTPVYENLSGARWVLPRAGSPARQLLDAFFAHIGIAAPSPVIETGDLAILRGVLLRSDMLAAVSAHQLEHEMLSGELVRLPLSLSHTTRPIGLISRMGALQSPAAKALMDKIREVVGEAAMRMPEMS
ncbi:LysR family transcriptional regulator [Pseudomonas sp. TH32]|jgi:LysR family transcriptional regulator of gallate degradation|uniref:LysR family transcriptional regulator n=1 Tax=Pseudomonas sp. TH32 TaxID=2796397 RepID=UPI001911359A|nr:LysR family transcriptional regulator [Pseudomonas sp. TH32]MBK5436727.1 LysR family transcriptional regulator [Pseudomonas sp. TH32]